MSTATTASTIYARHAHRLNAGGGPIQFEKVADAPDGTFAAEVTDEKVRRVLLKQPQDYSLAPIPLEVSAKVDTNWRLALAKHHSPKPRLQKIYNEDDIEEGGPKNPIAKQARGMNELLDLVRRREEQKIREFNGEKPPVPKVPAADPQEAAILPPVKPASQVTAAVASEPAVKAPTQLPFDVAALRADLAVERIAGVESKEALEQMLALERVRKQGPRQGVLAALSAKITELDDAV